MLECEACRAKVPEQVDRCPACGGRVLAPPHLLQRRWVLLLVYGAGFSLMGACTGTRVGVFFIAFFDRALEFFGLSPRRLGAAEQRDKLYDHIRDGERSLLRYPGASRLHERIGDNRAGSAPSLDVCWQADASIEDVLEFYRSALLAAGWFIRRDATRVQQIGAEWGQVRLLVHRPADRAISGLECPAGTTYITSFTAMGSRR
ncbi:MAG: hypothetical protein HY332_07240 [Chloroflexi bacterium]|nr:hypothetical protein [Chloroflexota bacterium]